jgi:copper chaperone CopZ
MEDIIISIPRMKCGGCVKNVQRALESLAGVLFIEADLANKTVLLRHEPEQTPLETIKSQLATAKYPVADEQTSMK